MTSKKTISVIIPSYNQSHFLADAINSVIAQTYTHWECIIINDGSTDATDEVARKFKQKDRRIIYHKQQNMGLSGARNTGLKIAKGEYIQFLDCDDLILETKFAEQIALLEESPNPAASICDFYYCDENDTNKRVLVDADISVRIDTCNPIADLISRWEEGLSIPAHCLLFDSRLFKDNNIEFDTSLQNHEDWDCWMRIFHKSPKTLFVDKQLAVYRKHTSSMSTYTLNMHKGFLVAIKRQKIHLSHSDDLLKLLHKKEQRLIKIYKKEAKLALSKRRKKKFIHFFRRNTPWPIQKIIAKLLP